MFKNAFSTGHFVKLAGRNLSNNLLYTLLNLVGLAIGLASAFMIYLWVYDEWKVDRFYEKKERIFQVMQNFSTDHDIITSEITPGLLASSLLKDMPEIESSSSIIPSDWFSDEGVILYKELNYKAGGQFVSKDYFNIFSTPLTIGSLPNQGWAPNDIYISESLAKKIFSTTDLALGQIITWNQKDYNGSYRIAGCFKDHPVNSTLKYDILFNYDLMFDKRPQLKSWGNGDPYTVLLLKKGTNLAAFNSKLVNYVSIKDNKIKPRTLFLRKFSDRYLYGKYDHGIPSGGGIEYLRLFGLIALFTLGIAVINFINLTTARAVSRFKEIGVKKVIGATRSVLMVQYMTESLLMAFLSMFLAIGFVILFIHPFNVLTGKDLHLGLEPYMLVAGVVLPFITGLIAGTYPSVYLSGFSPMVMMKRMVSPSSIEYFMRKGLIVFQFVISLVLIVAVSVIQKQIQYVHTKNLGYDRNHLIYFERAGISGDRIGDLPGYEIELNNYLQIVKNIPGVEGASNFRHTIINRQGGTTDVQWPDKPVDESVSFTDIPCGYGFIEALQIKMKEGRTYNKAYGAEQSSIIFNEAAIEAMGIKDPIGKVVKIWGSEKTIVGVTKNFHFESLYENLKPCFFDFSLGPNLSKIMVRMKPGTEASVIDRLNALQQERNPGLPFEYHFLDEDYNKLYQSEQRTASLSGYFADIAILISCIGLLGLASFMAQRRQKEMGIRKIIGAGWTEIMILLSKDFLKLIWISMWIAFPIAWYFMQGWLRRFSYKIDLDIYDFMIAGTALLSLTLLTISYQVLKSALTNPIHTIRNE